MATLLQQLPSGLEDWIQLIVLVLIFGGSAIAGFAKWIIKKLNPQEAEKPKEENARGVPVGRVEPAHPVARPIPMPAQRAPTVGGPTPAPMPPGSLPPETISTRPPVPVASARPQAIRADQRTRRMPAPASPPPRPPAARPIAAPQSAKTLEKRRKRGLQPSARTARSTPPEEEDRTFTHRSARIRSEPKDEASEQVSVGEFDAIKNPTVQALRQAIVMSEVLGPPLALRRPDDRLLWNQ